MFVVVTFIIAFLLGVPIAHYTAYFINNSEDCIKRVDFGFIKIRTVLISFINGFLWLVIYIVEDFSYLSVIYMVASSILLAIAVVDFAVFEIPFAFNVALGVLGAVAMMLDYHHFLSYLVGACLVSGIFLLTALVTKGNGMGGGDVKLMVSVGLLLGWKKVLLVMLLGCLIGIAVHGMAMLILKKKHMLPFGPYLSMAAFITMLYGDAIVGWYIDTFFSFYY